MKQFFSLLLVFLLTISCGSNSPTSSSGSGSFSWNGPIILSSISDLSGTTSAFTEIDTSTGPVTNAAVTLTSSGAPAVLTYQGSISGAVTNSGAVTTLSLAYYTNSSFTYTAGQPYTITAVFGGSTYSAYTTALGNIIFVNGGSSMTCNWTGGGNENVVEVEETSPSIAVSIYGPNVSSGVNVTLLGTHGDVFASLDNLNSSAFSGTSNGSYFVSSASALGSY